MAKLSNLNVTHQGADDGFQEAATQPKHALRKGEFDAAVSALQLAIDSKSNSDHIHSEATTDAAGFMSAADKAKLNALSGNENWRSSVAAKANLPLGVDPVGTCRLVRGEPRIYHCIAQTGGVDAQWEAMGGLSRLEKYAATIGDGESSVIDVAHGLNTEDVTWSVRQATPGGQFVLVGAYPLDGNTLRILFETAPPADSYRVVIVA